jgi:hypothetical protein
MFLDQLGLVSPPPAKYSSALAQIHVDQVTSLTAKGYTDISSTANDIAYNADSDGDNCLDSKC